MNKKEPKVLTRMRLSCCWGDNLNEKELNEVVDYINTLQQENKELKDNWNKLKDYILNKIDEYDTNLEFWSAELLSYVKNKMQELEDK